MERQSVIYQIKCKNNGFIYIGRTVDITLRWQAHQRALRNGNHANKPLQADYDKYGLDAFALSELETSEGEYAPLLEIKYIREVPKKLRYNKKQEVDRGLVRKYVGRNQPDLVRKLKKLKPELFE